MRRFVELCPRVLSCALASACAGDDASTGSASESSATSSSTSAATESGGSQSSTSVASGSTESGSTGGSQSSTSSGTEGTVSSGSGETTTSTGGEVCSPPERVSADFTFDGPPLVEAAACVLKAAELTPPTATYSLACGDEVYTVGISAEPFAAPSINLEDAVILDYRSDPIFWQNRWIALRSGGRTVFGGVSSSALDPPNTTIAAFFEDPVLSEVDGLCPASDEGCGPEERIALEMSFHGSPQLVFDHGTGYFNNLAEAVHLILEEARVTPQTTCDDYPEAWYQLVFAWHPSD